MPAKKKNTRNKTRARQKQESRKEIQEDLNPIVVNANPIKRQIKVNQLPWTDKQKEFFKKLFIKKKQNSKQKLRI